MTQNNRFADRALSPEIKKSLDGAGILVTGGTGSFGQAFVKELLKFANPSRLVIFSRDEQKQFDMEQRISSAVHPCLRYFI